MEWKGATGMDALTHEGYTYKGRLGETITFNLKSQ